VVANPIEDVEFQLVNLVNLDLKNVKEVMEEPEGDITKL
jgi:hypothetical protein